MKEFFTFTLKCFAQSAIFSLYYSCHSIPSMQAKVASSVVKKATSQGNAPMLTVVMEETKVAFFSHCGEVVKIHLQKR